MYKRAELLALAKHLRTRYQCPVVFSEESAKVLLGVSEGIEEPTFLICTPENEGVLSGWGYTLEFVYEHYINAHNRLIELQENLYAPSIDSLEITYDTGLLP